MVLETVRTSNALDMYDVNYKLITMEIGMFQVAIAQIRNSFYQVRQFKVRMELLSLELASAFMVEMRKFLPVHFKNA